MGLSRNISWSLTRSKTLAECPRKFYFEYYADEEPEGYAAYNLRELITLPMLAGEVVDLVIASALKRFRRGEPLPAGMGETGAKEFRQFVAASPKIVEAMRLCARKMDARRRHPARPLLSDWYGMDMGSAYVNRLEAQVRQCLTAFECSEVLRRILAADPAGWGELTRSMRERPYFEFADSRVYTSYDFFFIDSGDLFILDWKSGAPTARGYELAETQLSVYALYGVHKLSMPAERIRVQAVWLQADGDWKPTAVEPMALRASEDTIRSELARERGLITPSPTGYRANRADFPAKPAGKKCAECKYREICPEGRDACSHIGRS